MADLSLSGLGSHLSGSGESALTGSNEIGCEDPDDPYYAANAANESASPQALDRTMDVSAVGTPLPLSDGYAIEKAWQGAAMADYLKVLLNRHPNMTLDAMKELHEMKLLSEIFSAKKDKSTAQNSVTAALKNPRLQDVIKWADDLFGSIPAYRKDMPDAWKVKVLLAIRKGVKYINDDTKRAKYQVNIRADSVYRGDSPLDTERLKKMYMKTKDQDHAPDPKFGGNNNNDNNDNNDNDMSANKQGNYHVGDVIWVMDNAGKVYSHVSKTGRMHHSSFLAGDNICAGGDWKITDGKIEEISGQSGHYRPQMPAFKNALEHLEYLNVLPPERKVIKVWEISTKKEMRVSLQELRWHSDKYQVFKPS